jgi:uncharacterized membrane protein YphA (DoxX/SURF4 family)
MPRRNEVLDAGFTVRVLQLVVAAYLITLGLIGILHWNSGLAEFARGFNRAFGGSSSTVNLIIAIVELAAGVIVLAGVFMRTSSRLLYATTMIIAILWLIQIFVNFFAQDIFEPSVWVWLNRLAADLIILLALWLINRKYA